MAASASDRLDQAVTSSRLWCSACQALQPPLPSQVPSTFATAADYLSTFTPLLMEEAAESVRSSWEEADRKGKGAAVLLQKCVELRDGWRQLTLKPAAPGDKQQLQQLQRDRDAAVVVLTLTPTSQQQQQQQQQGFDPVRVTGLVVRWEVDGQEMVFVRVRPWCGLHAWGSGPCCMVYQQLTRSITSGTHWQLTPAGSTVTAQREMNTLSKLNNIRILTFLLNPAAVHQQNPGPQSDSSSSAGSALNLNLPPEVNDSPFKLHLTATYDQPQVDAILKCAAHVQQQQRGSSDGGSSGSSGGGWSPPVSLIQGPPGTGKTFTVLGVLNTWHMVLYHRYYHSLDMVVQQVVEGSGRPGGRIDKVLLSDGFKARLAPRPRILVCAPSNAATDELLERVMRGGFMDKNRNKYNPNMIRLGSEEALSSAAQEVWVEQLAGRLLALEPQQFHAELQACLQEERSLMTALANLADSVMAMRDLVARSQQEAAADPGNHAFAAKAAQQSESLQQVITRLVQNFERLRAVRVDLARRQIVQELVIGNGATKWARQMQKLRKGRPPQQQQQQQQQREEWRQAFRMAPRDLQQQLEGSYIEDAEMVFTTLSSSGREVFSRLAVPFPLVLLDEAGQATEVASLQPLVYGARGVVMVGDPQQLPATIFSQAGKQVALERSLFERLAAGGCPVNMLRVQYRMHPAIRTFPSAYFYQNALVDADSVLLREGAWYTQQPTAATAAAATANGGPAAGVNAAIGAPRSRSSTPELAAAAGDAGSCRGSNDGSSSGSGSSAASFLLPYGVFNVRGGVEHNVGRSKANAAEAALAVELYRQLRPALVLREAATAAEAAARQELLLALPSDVGIVTPYRGQRDLIRDKLVQQFGPGELSRVRVETIDSFQGKQLDVVILSLTRAGGQGGQRGFNAGAPMTGGMFGSEGSAAAGNSGGQMLPLNRAGVGFLSDVRRMNVAITRARLSCLILGHTDTLQQNAAWAELVADASSRSCLFDVPSVEAVLQQQHRQKLLPLIQSARQHQQELVVQLRQKRDLRLPEPTDQQQQVAVTIAPQQQQQQQQQEQQAPLPAPVAPSALQHQQQEQQQFADASGRPWKQQRLGHPGSLAAAAAVGGSGVRTPAAAAAGDVTGVYARMQPAQAAVAWGLWPLVLELQQRVAAQQQQPGGKQ